MKAIIFSISVMFLSLSVQAQSVRDITHLSCRKDPLQYSPNTTIKINCPEYAPGKALEALFVKELAAIEKMEQARPNLASMSLFKHTDAKEAGVNYVMFQTLDHGFYVYPGKNGEVQMEQNNGSGCQYRYKIKKEGNRSVCTIDPKTLSQEPVCTKLISNDPLIDAKNQNSKVCTLFIEAMQSCAKTPDACKKIAWDTGVKKQAPNEYNKAAPSSTHR